MDNICFEIEPIPTDNGIGGIDAVTRFTDLKDFSNPKGRSSFSQIEGNAKCFVFLVCGKSLHILSSFADLKIEMN